MLRGDVELGGGVPSGAVEQQNGVGAVGDMARDFLRDEQRKRGRRRPRAGQMAPKREALSSADRRVGEAAFLAACEGVRQVRAHGRDVLSQRLRQRSRRQLLCLPRRQRAKEIPPHFLDKGRHDPLLRSQADCDTCALKPKCCPNAPARKIARSVQEAARDKARAIAKTEAYVVSRRERKKVEMLFAHLKRILRLDRLRLRGPNGAKDEFLLAATAQNLRKLAKLIPLPAPIFAT
jgi:hypothetical protein